MPATPSHKEPHCPFCSEPVAEELVLHGGQCPHCFGDIPGEEAPTDPGEHRQKEQEIELKKEARKVERGNALPRILGLSVLLAVAISVVAGVTWASLPPPQLPTLRISDDDVVYGTEAVAVVETPTPAPAGITAPKPGGGIHDPRAMKLPGAGAGTIGGTAGGVDLSGAKVAVGPGDVGGGPKSVDLGLGGGPISADFGSASASGGDLALDVKLGGPSRREIKGATLNDDDQIVEMAKRVVKTNQPGLRPCYERSLKRTPELGGVWNLKFTVTTGGDVRSVTLAPTTASDPEMEGCIVQKVQTWAFQPIKAELPIEKALTFRPN